MVKNIVRGLSRIVNKNITWMSIFNETIIVVKVSTAFKKKML